VEWLIEIMRSKNDAKYKISGETEVTAQRLARGEPVPARVGSEAPLLFTVTAAAHFLGLSRTTVVALLNAGQLRYRRIGADRRIPRTELIQFANRDLVGAET
jgi:excisionase family DNA binding protein